MNPLLMSALLIVGLAVFGRTMYFKIRLLMALEPTNRADHITQRLKNMVVIAIGQKRLAGSGNPGSSMSLLPDHAGRRHEGTEQRRGNTNPGYCRTCGK